MKTAASPSKSISSEIYVETVTHISADITEVRSGKSSFFNLPRKMSRLVQKGWEFLNASSNIHNTILRILRLKHSPPWFMFIEIMY